MTRFDAVLFDAGDTLIRLSGNGAALLQRAAETLGAGPLDPDEVDEVWQRVLSRASTADELAKGRDLSGAQHEAVWTALYADAGCDRLAPGLSAQIYALTVLPESWEAFPDAEPTLRALREHGLRVGIVSDTGFDLRPVFDRLGLTRYVDTVVLSYEHGICKPAVKPFQTACDQLQVRPERTLMVGDNPITDSGGVLAGMYVFLLPRATPDGPRGLDHVLSLVRNAG